MSADIIAILQGVRVLPVLTIDDVATAAPLARALAAGGLRVLEVTLRTPAALGAITAMRAAAPDCVVGAGTALSCVDISAAADAGAQFAVSPGMTASLRAGPRALPWLAGVATASDVMAGLEAGLTLFKFFPSESAGGAAMLASFSGPFPQARFCPTGGIGPATIAAYRRLGNVVCVGGSWMIDQQAIRDARWADVTAAARTAAAL